MMRTSVCVKKEILSQLTFLGLFMNGFYGDFNVRQTDVLVTV